MGLLLGAVSSSADAVDAQTRKALAGRVFFPSPKNPQHYDSFIVYLRDDAAPSDVHSRHAVAKRQQLDASLAHIGATVGLKLARGRRLATGGYVIHVGGKALDVAASEQLMLTLAGDPKFLSIEPNTRFYPSVLPNDPLLSFQWALTEPTAGINVEPVWDAGYSGNGVVIAVIDTGITAHPELDAKMLPGADMISDPANARDGDGRDTNPSDEGDWNVADECGQGKPAHDSTWHGTHVAGIAAAISNNGVGVAAPAYNATLLPVRVLGRCGGSLADIADGMVWASGGAVTGLPNNANPADVLNLSLGGQSECSPTYQTAINSARANGSVLVVAAGNSNTLTYQFTPANCDGVIAIASNRRDGGRASYSNYGAVIDLASPGGDSDVSPNNGILSTVNLGLTTPGVADFGYKDGTSMATPYVSGVIALMLQANSALTPDQVEDTLRDTAWTFAVPCTGGCGTGIVDAAAAVSATLGTAITSVPLSLALYGNGQGTVSSSPAGINCGTQSGTQCSVKFSKNSSVTLSATPAPGYVFAGWFGPCNDSNPTCVVSMQHAADVFAAFSKPIVPLSNNVPINGLSAALNDETYYSFVVPAGASNLNIAISGGTGDADLFVRVNDLPTTTTFDCQSITFGNNDSCAAATPPAGTHYILLQAASAYSGVSLIASYQIGGSTQWIFCNGMEDGLASCGN